MKEHNDISMIGELVIRLNGFVKGNFVVTETVSLNPISISHLIHGFKSEIVSTNFFLKAIFQSKT